MRNKPGEIPGPESITNGAQRHDRRVLTMGVPTKKPRYGVELVRTVPRTGHPLEVTRTLFSDLESHALAIREVRREIELRLEHPHVFRASGRFDLRQEFPETRRSEFLTFFVTCDGVRISRRPLLQGLLDFLTGPFRLWSLAGRRVRWA